MRIHRRVQTTDAVAERHAAELLGPIAAERPSAGAVDAAQAALVTAAAGGPAGRGVGMRQRFALGLGALVMPLMAVGAVGAATGQGPLDAPSDVVTSAANAVGIGGKSGGHRNDFDKRAEPAGDNGQPGSCPGKSCDAPGHNKSTETASADASGTPETNASKTPKADKTKTDPHANGKGCDDKLFATGTPPFGGHDTPVGPCKDDDEDDGETPEADESHEAEGEGDGGGNGNGHDKGRGNGHGQGTGNGHEKDGDAGATPAEGTPTGSRGGSAPGNSGAAKEKNR